MSWEATTYVLGTTVGDTTRKFVLLGYANHAHHDGTNAYASAKTIASYAECSQRTVQRHLAVLVREGFLREGDQSAISSKIPVDRRPIVYDVAMSDEQRARWKAEYDQGPSLRAEAAGYGAQGGRKAAENRGVRLSPRGGGDDVSPKSENQPRGDNLTPRENTGRGDTHVTRRGDTGDATGVTPVSPKPSLNLTSEEDNYGASADAVAAQPTLLDPTGDHTATASAPKPVTVAARADAVLKPWWDALEVKPMQRYIVIRKAVEGALGNGHDPDVVRRCLDRLRDEGMPVSGGSLQVALRRIVGGGTPEGRFIQSRHAGAASDDELARRRALFS